MKTSRNPDTIHAPIGRYVHQVEVGSPSRLLFISGQVGMRPDGSVPEDTVDQLEVALENVVRNLEAAGLEATDLVKAITYVVMGSPMDLAKRRAVLERLFGEHIATSTLVYVAGLASPEYKVEVDAWAAR